jgi:glutamate racemase
MTRACPEWVVLVESGTVDGPDAEALVGPVVGDMAAQGADVIVLACTHFSFLKPLIERIGGLTVVDPAPAVAAQTARVAPAHRGSGSLVLAASGDIDQFARLSSALARIEGPVIPFPA